MLKIGFFHQARDCEEDNQKILVSTSNQYDTPSLETCITQKRIEAISRIISRQNWPQNGESTNLKISLIRVLHQRRLRHQSELGIDWMVIASSSRSGTMRKKFPIIRIEDAWKNFSKQLGGFMEIRHSKNRNAPFHIWASLQTALQSCFKEVLKRPNTGNRSCNPPNLKPSSWKDEMLSTHSFTASFKPFATKCCGPLSSISALKSPVTSTGSFPANSKIAWTSAKFQRLQSLQSKKQWKGSCS